MTASSEDRSWMCVAVLHCWYQAPGWKIALRVDKRCHLPLQHLGDHRVFHLGGLYAFR